MNKLKLVRLNVDKKYLWGARAVMFLAATPFLWDLYQVFITGFVQDGRTIATFENGKLFYSIIAKKLAFAMLFVWLCTGGIVSNKESIEKEEEQTKG
jgi:hypothetical protein